MFGLIGYPLHHSFSAKYFNDFFARTEIPEYYELFPIRDIDEFPLLLKKHRDLEGLNVTIPYKEKIIPFLTDLSEEAREIGAVNTIRILNRGKILIGHNTDAIGFKNSISPLLMPHMKKALILGTGGASKAVDYVLKKLGLEVTKVSRRESEGVMTYDQLDEDVISSHHVIVNTTPLGTWPDIDKYPDIPYQFLSPLHLCFDLVYNPETTSFMRKSAEHGAMVKNGLEMLHGQADAAWRIWVP
uniref:Putative shikimate 5-dehydrogenase n=2 Tax=Bacteria TaxID=2 RepID=R4JBK9_9BACT|nr:putative shikimate 5-dehydrogenase [uncultured bacterium BAC25G1]